MRILITGGFGFIGGRLAEYLLQSGYEVILGSRNQHIPPKWLPQAEVVKTNWSDVTQLESICEGVDVIVNTAGMNAKDCIEDPSAALDFNGKATARLLVAASRAGVKKFIYLSTAHVYASPLVGVITEDMTPRNSHPYATSNIAGENAVLEASKNGLIQGVVLRLSNIYGTPMDQDMKCWTLLVNNLCKQVVQTGRLVLETNGTQERDFICITEICRVIDFLISKNQKLTKHLVFNLGTGVSTSVIEMTNLIQKRCIKVLDFNPPIEKLNIRSGILGESLIYRNDNLTQLGIDTKSTNNLSEIDKLLHFCNKTFTSN